MRATSRRHLPRALSPFNPYCAPISPYPSLSLPSVSPSLSPTHPLLASTTPTHRPSLPLPFPAQREDLSSDTYGGNKVRTLQHQLAVCEAKIARGDADRIIVTGTGGSNQIVATVAHAASLANAPRVAAAWLGKDVSNLDNTLNMLSALSFPLDSASATWGEALRLLPLLVRERMKHERNSYSTKYTRSKSHFTEVPRPQH